ncbi:MAG: sigma-70 family RNA polymerase sigma factor [Candidatus Marinimicrobia bacterium]|nr:sigma-70 family RNA polymerase sigma factor [Candidatus Neomarinimicrobiota bacterium]MCF7828609.1 sigma-70 family RNA polymerase sigma factor [Candidatus Neomarinimicrobiota bacterium]MCF7880350.1 sigma-70 family RNA polymerase sigma factor [Candidatus Neomarinimicrobiota bacterium]
MTTSKSTYERTLLHRCRNGNTNAFSEIVKQYQSYAYSLAIRLLWNAEDAEDAVQECFLRIWKNFASYDPERKFTTWLYTIVTNICYDMLRRRQRDTELRGKDSVDISELQHAPRNSANTADTIVQLKCLASGLPVQQRLVFILRDVQDLSVFETAEILAISENAVKSNLYYARRALRERYRQLMKQ